MVSSRFGQANLPLRLSYEGPVLRHVPAQKGRSRELHQVGAELLGVVDPEADAEAIALAVACLSEAGVEGFKVDIGQVEFFRGVLSDCRLGEEQTETLTRCVARKDVSDLERLLRDLPLSDRKKQLLAELPLLAGDVSVLDRAAALVESDHSRRALDNLAQVVEYVAAAGLARHLTVDLGELRGIDYHTGVIFEAFVHHLGTALCRGGRYDHLLGRYGVELPATGFSLDLLALLEALHFQAAVRPLPRRGAFIINFLADRTQALDLARRLRQAGTRAARDLIRRPLEDSLAHAGEQGFRWAAVLGGPECPAGCAVLTDLETGDRATLKIDQVAQHAAEERAKCRTS
jgi:ATP phosphoribosyltransferase regulatory subunit